jgi:hypothetical protein
MKVSADALHFCLWVLVKVSADALHFCLWVLMTSNHVSLAVCNINEQLIGRTRKEAGAVQFQVVFKNGGNHKLSG